MQGKGFRFHGIMTKVKMARLRSLEDIIELESAYFILHFPGHDPKGIIKFLGGAFIGTSPDITYSHFIELLANEGFVTVAVPHNITFDHTAQARGIHFRFNKSLDTLYSAGVPQFGLDPDDLSKLPIYCVGYKYKT